jgi:hypothetical protein
LAGGDREGRLRPFPPKAVLGPAFTPGEEENEPWLLSGPFTGLLDAQGFSRTPRTPVNGRDKEKQQHRN